MTAIAPISMLILLPAPVNVVGVEVVAGDTALVVAGLTMLKVKLENPVPTAVPVPAALTSLEADPVVYGAAGEEAMATGVEATG